MYPPGRVPAFGWAEKTRMSQPASTCFLPRQATPTRPGLEAKRLHVGARPVLRILCGFGAWGRNRVQVSLEHERFVWGRGGYVRGFPLTCTFGTFSCIRKGARRAGPNTPHPLPPTGSTLNKKGNVLRSCTSCQMVIFPRAWILTSESISLNESTTALR